MGDLSDEDAELQQEETAALETYIFMKAAQWMAVPPWELLDKPLWWVGIADACRHAEIAAQNAKRKKK